MKTVLSAWTNIATVMSVMTGTVDEFGDHSDVQMTPIGK